LSFQAFEHFVAELRMPLHVPHLVLAEPPLPVEDVAVDPPLPDVVQVRRCGEVFELFLGKLS